MDEDEILWYPLGVRCPYTQKIIHHEPGVLVFNGYFYLEDQTMPVKRMASRGHKTVLIEITSKKEIKDTSVYGAYDPEIGAGICFFPTCILEIKYKIIKVVESTEEFHKLCKEIEALEVEILERNTIHKNKREEEEFKKHIEYCKTLDYKSFFENIKENTTDNDLDDI